MGKQLRKIARRSQRVVAGWPKMSRETELSIIFPPGVLRGLSGGSHMIDGATNFERGLAKYLSGTFVGKEG